MGGSADEVSSATWLLVELVVGVASTDGTPEVEFPADTVALLLTDALAKGGAGRLQAARKGWCEACALRAQELVRCNKLGSSEDSTIWVVMKKKEEAEEEECSDTHWRLRVNGWQDNTKYYVR